MAKSRLHLFPDPIDAPASFDTSAFADPILVDTRPGCSSGQFTYGGLLPFSFLSQDRVSRIGGSEGNDTISGGAGKDTMTSSAGND